MEPPRWATVTGLVALQEEASPGFDRTLAERLLRRSDHSGRATFGSLSKGQRRWVLAALALASEAELLLLDEPAEGLDPTARRAFYDTVREIANERTRTVIVATHIVHDIERVADEVVILDRGRLLIHASLEELRDEVRDIELPLGQSLPDFSDVDLLACDASGDALLAWVRCRDGLEALNERLGATRSRTVGLEELYIALTVERRGLEGRE